MANAHGLLRQYIFVSTEPGEYIPFPRLGEVYSTYATISKLTWPGLVKALLDHHLSIPEQHHASLLLGLFQSI